MQKSEQEFEHLYQFAIMYARVSRSSLVEIEDATQEMLLMAITCKFKSREYVKRAMRNRYFELLRRAKMVRSYTAEMDERDEPAVDEEPKWEAKDTVTKLILAVPKEQAVVLNHVMAGRTAKEIHSIERVSTRTVNRYISKAKTVAELMMN